MWRRALESLEIRHPNGRSNVVLRVDDGGSLFIGLDETSCTLTGEPKKNFAISTVKLTFFPGVRLARAWMAAAWCGYLQHEALELVTVGGRAVLDPHAEPYATNPFNRGLRDGMPVVLTARTMVDTLALVMPFDHAVNMVYADNRGHLEDV